MPIKIMLKQDPAISNLTEIELVNPPSLEKEKCDKKQSSKEYS